MMKELRIACDIDDCIANFLDPYFSMYGKPKKNDYEITRNVYKLRNNKSFWENLPVLERMDFEPHIYCTKRINNKEYTKNWLKKNNFPLKPIYQLYNQRGNKANLIKGKCDVLIDDSYKNVIEAITAGLPALLLTRPHNEHIITPYRINKLEHKEITKKYEELFRSNT